MRLHLGCGRTILEGWVNLDVVAGPGVDIVFDLDACATSRLPFADGSVDEFLASHVLEHLRQPLPLMEELHRVAKPNALAVFRVPYGSSDDAGEDPTHVRQFFLGSFAYFGQPVYWRADYGYRGDWRTERISLLVDGKEYAGRTAQDILADVRRYRNVVREMIAELRAVKPIRPPRRELRERPPIRIVLVDV